MSFLSWLPLGWIFLLLIVESIIPFNRNYKESRAKHLGRNAILTALIFAVNAIVFVYTAKAIDYAHLNNYGWFNRISAPMMIEYISLFILYDLLLYWWHWLNHNARFFWAFHQVHHSDAVLDFSTATRIHVLELTYFAFARLFFVFLFGADLLQLVFLETLVTLAALWHHSNIKLPKTVDHRLQQLIVTPGMHRLHHSIKQEQRNSNYTTTITIWDKLFQSYHPPIKNEDELIFGLDRFAKASDRTLLKLLLAPFNKYPNKKS